MAENPIQQLLRDKGIRPTPNRILVLRSLMQASRPLSLAELEEQLDFTVDKSAIFRVLELFALRDAVHVIEDGTRSLKYEPCLSAGPHTPTDQHVHFYCERCRTTFCLEEVGVPCVPLPEGFAVHSVNFLIKGVCPACSGR